jgi:beta-glucosidase-like glycosyl hydrolase/CubicO group peptidase (beta-lactamase class C family)
MIDSLKVGGVCFFKGNEKTLIKLNEKYSSLAKVPLFFGIDAEWGLEMRMEDGFSFYHQLSLGASSDSNLVYKMGLNLAKQLRSLGLNINFAPSVDINLNYKNPIIGSRSFGEDKDKVAYLGWAYAKGLQDGKVLPSVKHFPGHGDTQTDSHYSLPIINHSKEFIDSIDSYPFRYAIDKGVKMVMVGHINIPTLIKDSLTPASLSDEAITDYLKNELCFEGLVVTDALNMKGVTNTYKDGEAEVKALMAGVDILLMPKNEYKAVEAIIKAIEEGRISPIEIDEKCRKVLQAKYDLGLFDTLNNIELQLPSEEIIDEANKINELFSKEIITLVKNKENNFPIYDTTNCSIAIVHLGDNALSSDFDSIVKMYNKTTTTYNISDKDSLVLDTLNNFTHIITILAGNIKRTEKHNYGISNKALKDLYNIQERYNNTSLALFANPYSLKFIDSLKNIKTILIGYQKDKFLEIALAKSIFGQINPKGMLPITASDTMPLNYALSYDEHIMHWVKYSKGKISLENIKKIDSIANYGIIKKAYPGCQIIVLYDTNIVYKQQYGFFTYDSIKRVDDNTIYDLASITKALATNLAMMRLYDEKKYNLDDRLSKYLPYLRFTNKRKITIREVLAHNSGLKASLPFYNDEKIKDKKDILKAIAKSKLNKTKNYVYSDLGFILLGDLIERLSSMPLNEYVEENFYKPLGLKNTCFNPLDNDEENIENIAPTERDDYFRNELILGKVHDPTAYIMDGVAGHAGLFSSCDDLAIILKMLINNGAYNGKRYISQSTINTFNTRYFKNNRRVLGFDKPVMNPKNNNSPSSQYSSQKSYGHTGFTGTFFWIDEKEKVSLIFLSNRVYPSAKENRLAKENIRTNIHDIIYQAIKK